MSNCKSKLHHKSLGWVISSGVVLAAMSLSQAATLAQAAGGVGSDAGDGGNGGAQSGKSVAQALAERRQRSGTLRAPQDEASVSMYVFSDGNKTINLRNGKVESVTIDGKDIPIERATADGNDVVVIDQNGKEIARFAGAGSHLSAAGQGKLQPLDEGNLPQKMNRLFDLRSAPRPGGGRMGQSSRLTAEAPKVMLGISMAKPSAELSGHFGIKAGEVTLVSFVHKDTPAAAAGLRQYDLLTRVKLGNATADDVATPEKIRELMRDAKPGDEVEFKVIQRGAEKTLKVKLVAYDETKLPDGPAFDSLPGEMTIFGPGGMAGQGAGAGAFGGGRGNFGGALPPGPGGQAGIAAPPGMPPMPRDLNDQQAWREFGDAFRGMGERYKENGGNPFIVLEPPVKGEGPIGGGSRARGDVSMHELMQRLEERLATMEQALRDLKTPGDAEKAPAGDGKDAGPKRDKKQGALRGGGGETRTVYNNIKRVISMPKANAL